MDADLLLTNNLLLTLDARETDGRLWATLSQGSTVVAGDEIPREAAGRARDLLGRLADFPKTDVPDSDLAGLGDALAAAALPPAVRAALQAMLAGTASSSSAVRLRIAPIRLDLACLPWEFLSWEETRGRDGRSFLGLHPRLRLVREPPPGAVIPPSAPPVTGSVRLLLAYADPGTPEYPLLAHLMAEVDAVRAALTAAECRRVEVQALDRATPAALHHALRSWQPHLLHLIGHGDVLPTGGALVLHGEREGQAAFVYADELAGWLRETPVRLAVLSACRTGAAGGPARSLSAAGVPSVVAMQLPLRDAAAGLFSRAFYAALLEPCPVEEALYQARQAVRGMGLDWGVPLLYQSAVPGFVFAPAPALLPPNNLPYRPSEAFVGRDGMMDALHRTLRREGRSAALIGMSGLGKTQLAGEYAHAHRADFPGGVFWVGARTTSQLTDDLAALGRRFFGAPEDWPPQQASVWAQEALARTPEPALLVCDDVTAESNLRLLPPTGACRLLLTMQEGYLTPPGISQFFLPMLDEAAARTLLGAKAVGEAERQAAAEIARLLGGLPLALALVASHIARLGLSFAEYHTRLATATFETLDNARRRVQAPTGHAGAVHDALSLSFRGLTTAAQDVLTAAATLGPYRITGNLLFETWAGGTRAQFEEAVGDLADGTLVTRGDAQDLSVHELMRAFARERIAPADHAGIAARASVSLTRRLSRALETNTAAARSAARHEAAHADVVAAQCRKFDLIDTLVPLLLVMGKMACEAGRFTQARSHIDEGLSLLRSGRAGASTAAQLLRERSNIGIEIQDMKSALSDARAALSLARRAAGRDRLLLTPYYTQVGLCARHLEKFSRARRFYDRALAFAEATYGRNHRSTAECLNNIGTLMEFQGDLDGALAKQVEALHIFRDVLQPGEADVGVSLNNLGRLLGRLGRWVEALTQHEEALALYLSAYEGSYGRRHPDVARSLFYAAEAQRALGRESAALSGYEEALPLYEFFYGIYDTRTTTVQKRLAQGQPCPKES